MMYNCERPLFTLKEPQNVEGAIAFMEQLRPFIQAENGSLRSKILATQIENMTAVLISKKLKDATPSEKGEIYRRQYEHTAQASTLSREAPEFDPFLKTLYLANRLKVAMNCRVAGQQVATPEEMRSWASTLLQEVERENFNHFYYSQFLIHIAQLEIDLKNPREAEPHLLKALETNERYKSNTNYSQVNGKILELLDLVRKS